MDLGHYPRDKEQGASLIIARDMGREQYNNMIVNNRIETEVYMASFIS